MKEKDIDYLRPFRLSFPDDEKIYDWLSPLLNAYYIVDKGIAEAIRREKKRKRRVACAKGCSNCCRTHKTIPVYPLELVGISWYVIEKVSGNEREILKSNLRYYKENEPCPFLLNGSCIIHPMRPVSCRQFIVFSKPCAEGEDPYYTRIKDVLMPPKNYIEEAFFIMLPFYGVKDESERRKAIKSGAIHKMVKLIQTCNWKSLADKMDDFDKLRNNKTQIY
ncbi:MAG: YkgJ family cysteine cluster protein [Thermodesulfovibrionales bacterium]